jgi:Skp family chaperone for outer membrane proteins
MRTVLFSVLSALSLAFAQGGAIKFQIPLDSSGMPATPPPKQEPQKLGVTANMPLNLAELSARDTASFDTYSKRLALVQDSIKATQREIESVSKKSVSLMQPLEPKGEFERQAEFDARKAKWEKDSREMMQRDTKSLTDRLASFEATRKKIEENQASLLCTIEVRTSPEAAAIWLNKEEIGSSPAEYRMAPPGHTVIRIQKENYEPWDTTFTLQPAQKLKISVALQEKSIFSKEGEIDLRKILARDTTAKGYMERIGRVEARMKQTDEEIKTMLEDFSNKYPALEPQKPNETAQDFERRKTAWTNEGMRQYGALQKKHATYRGRLVRSLEVLADNMTEAESQLMTETPLNAKIMLGAYDVEREAFEVAVEDTASTKTPFHFAGMVGVPLDTAKAMNRSTDGFAASISYINYPFVIGDSSFNLAMKGIAISRKALPLKAEGTFKPVGRFEAMEGYGAWRAHADSILSGALKSQGLGMDYALNEGGKANAAAEAGGGGLGWRGWTRILAFTATAACGTLAVMKHIKAGNYTDKINALNRTAPQTDKNGEYTGWYNANARKFDEYKKTVEDNDGYRNIYGAGAGAFAIAGTLTFIF